MSASSQTQLCIHFPRHNHDCTTLDGDTAGERDGKSCVREKPPSNSLPGAPNTVHHLSLSASSPSSVIGGWVPWRPWRPWGPETGREGQGECGGSLASNIAQWGTGDARMEPRGLELLSVFINAPPPRSPSATRLALSSDHRDPHLKKEILRMLFLKGK